MHVVKIIANNNYVFTFFLITGIVSKSTYKQLEQYVKHEVHYRIPCLLFMNTACTAHIYTQT